MPVMTPKPGRGTATDASGSTASIAPSTPAGSPLSPHPAPVITVAISRYDSARIGRILHRPRRRREREDQAGHLVGRRRQHERLEVVDRVLERHDELADR